MTERQFMHMMEKQATQEETAAKQLKISLSSSQQMVSPDVQVKPLSARSAKIG